jgi:general secretion pathway protein L
MDYLILQAEETRLTVAHFRISRRAAEIIGAAAVDLGAEHSLEDAVRNIAEKMTGSPRIILCLPPSLFAQRTISLPFQDLRKVREVLPGHLQGEIALPVDELVLGVLPTGEGQFLALWARRSDVGQALETFRAAGLEPHIISSVPFALSELPGVPPGCIICQSNFLTILNDGHVTYFRTFQSQVTATNIASTLSALELSGGALPSRLCLLGPEFDVFTADSALPLPIETISVPPELGHLFKNEETFRQLAPLYAVARTCQTGTLPDFRQGDLAWTAGNVRVRRKLILTGILTAVVLILLFITKGLQYRTAVTDLASVNKSIGSLYREIFPTRTKAVDELSEIRGEIRKLSGIENSNSYLNVLKKLAEAKGNSIIGLYEAELEGANLRIKGDASSAQKVNEFKASLASLLTSAELGEVKSRPDGTVGFSLTGTLRKVIQ